MYEGRLKVIVQAFLDFCGFDLRDFQFNAVYNSILFSSPLVLLSNLDLRGFRFPRFFMCPHINRIRGIPVIRIFSIIECSRKNQMEAEYPPSLKNDDVI